jgi:hypothetical protein
MVAVPPTLFGSVVASRCYDQAVAALEHVGMGCTVAHMNSFDLAYIPNDPIKMRDICEYKLI